MAARKYSHSALKTAQRCLKQWSYKYIDRLEPKDRPKYFEEGSDLHELLEKLYAEGLGFDEYVDLYDQSKPEHQAILNRYSEFWEEEDKDWEVVFVEEDLEMKVGPYTVVFKPDLVIRLHGNLWVVDHKTVAEIPDETDPYNMSDFQHLLYLEGVRQHTGEMPAGFVFNYVRRKLPRQPELVKKGDRIADLRRMDTDYDTLHRFAEAHGQLSDPDVQEKLKILNLTPNRYFQRHYITANETAIDEAYWDTYMELQKLNESERTHTYPRHVLGGYAGSAACARCPYQPLCFSEMMGINTDVVALDYIERPKREK